MGPSSGFCFGAVEVVGAFVWFWGGVLGEVVIGVLVVIVVGVVVEVVVGVAVWVAVGLGVGVEGKLLKTKMVCGD